MTAFRSDWDQRYQSGETPWDTQQTPPEVVRFWRDGCIDPNGLALDIGAGSGTNALFLAGLGLHVVALDVSGSGLGLAKDRLSRLVHRPKGTIDLVQSDAAKLPFLCVCATYILDVGCFHSLPFTSRPGYARGIITNLAPGGFYHLYAFDRSDDAQLGTSGSHRGLGEKEVALRFGQMLEIVSVERGTNRGSPSRWYLLRKPNNARSVCA